MLLASLVTVFLFAASSSRLQVELVALFAVAVFNLWWPGSRRGLVAAITAVVVLGGGGAFIADKVAGGLDAAGHERSLPAHRPDGESDQAPSARRGRSRLPAEGEPGRLEERCPPSLFVSHTTPLTVLASLASSGYFSTPRSCSAPRRRSCVRSGSRTRSGSRSPRYSPALFVHSLFYSGFFEIP